MSLATRIVAASVAIAATTAVVLLTTDRSRQAEPATVARPTSPTVSTSAAEAPPRAQSPGTPRVRRPPIVERLIPFPPKRKQEMRAYSERHYGQSTYRLVHPHVIVEHFTANDSVAATYSTFAADVPDVELHELPGTCSHFVIARNGTIYELVPIELRCRHTVGLNWTAIGIEHVGNSDAEVLGDRRQMRASIRLTTWLRCREHIRVRNVIGHHESLTSPYHHERVAGLRTQTHVDMAKPAMDVYRRLLRSHPCP